MSKKSGFAPDGRSPLGRKMIAANMLQHMEKVQQTKSSIDDHLVPSMFSFIFITTSTSKSFLSSKNWTKKEASCR